MLLAAHGAIKPLAATDPFWGSVVFLQTFDSLTVGDTIASTWPNQKSGQSYSGAGALWQVISTPVVSGLAVKQTVFGSEPTLTLGTAISGVFTVETSHRINNSVPQSHYFLSLYDAGFGVVAQIFNQSNSFWVNNGVSTVNTGTSIAHSTWYDIAIARDASNNVRYFVNGLLVATQTNSGALKSIVVPSYDTGAAPVPSDTYFIDDFRITSACRYTASYTPSHPFIAA